MRKVVVSEFITLDGVFENPGGGEDSKHGGWSFQFNTGPEGQRYKFDEVMRAEALLLGRITYQGFAAAWPSMQDEARGLAAVCPPSLVQERSRRRRAAAAGSVGDLSSPGTPPSQPAGVSGGRG